MVYGVLVATHVSLGRMSIYVDDPDGYHLELTVAFETGEIEKRGLLSSISRN